MFTFSRLLVVRGEYVQKTAIVLKRTSPLYKSIYIKRTYHASQEKKSFCCGEFMCKVREIGGLFSPWFILRKFGVPCQAILKFRRGIKRFYFPWLAYSIPLAITMGIGDVLAQLYQHHVTDRAEKTAWNFAKKRTAKFMLTGFLIVGPLASKANRMIMRRISFFPAQSFLIKRIAIKVLVISPLILLAAMAFYDYEQIQDCYDHGKNDYLWEKRYKLPFQDIMSFNLLTRPLVELSVCLLPFCVRNLARKLYEILFFAYSSSVIHKYKLGQVSNLCHPAPLTVAKKKRFCKLRKHRT
ncbi:hypothetical protein O3M35_004713 [Rhynocoris fuscipes]|uniref:Uncharacterized protein n=1 Tax=Rhynocoris fuscipes TaxID=488301 RepID=A0AAW1CGA5_9HEMI